VTTILLFSLIPASSCSF